MFCSSCGRPVPDASQFCPECGARQGAPEQGYQPIMYQSGIDYSKYAPSLEKEALPLNKDARTGLICGIVALATMYFPFVNGVPGVLGIIFSLKGLKEAEKLRGSGKGKAITGICLSGAGLAMGIYWICFYFYKYFDAFVYFNK